MTRTQQPGQNIEQLLRLLEELLPIHDIHLHISNDLPVTENPGMDSDELEALARRMLDAFRDQPDSIQLLLDRLPLTDPFSRDPENARRIAEALRT
jgi:hypothetical protein